MFNTDVLYNLGQTVLSSSGEFKKSGKKARTSTDPEENQIIEEYEGDCEECEKSQAPKKCPICGE